MKRIPLSLSVALALSCGASSGPEQPTGPLGGSIPSRPRFENPGGMWMPSQLAEHADVLSSLGLELDPASLSDPLAAPLGAIVSLGGCSASFVSPEGLIITNHHCVQGALQYHSNADHNYVKDGFLAATRADEKWNGPTAKVWVTSAISEVTDKVLVGLDAIADDRARYDEIEKREKELTAACEKDRPGVRCGIYSYFGGAEFYQVEKLEIRDVRLVYAPEHAIGFFGGDEDNWMWPRHCGDYSFYRAYVGPDGKPADYSPNNVPYRPDHHLKLASTPLVKGDLVMVAGYPGRTYRHQTAFEVAQAVEWSYPRRIAMYDEYLQVFEQVAKSDKEAAVKAQLSIFGLQNAVKNSRGMMDGLVAGGLARSRATSEQKLRQWIADDPQRSARYGDVFASMDAIQQEMLATRERDAAIGELDMGDLLGVASTIVRMAEERAKPDAERDPSFQERNWARLRARMEAFDKRYNRTIDRAVFAKAIERATRDRGNADWLKSLFGTAELDSGAIDKLIDRYFANPALEEQKTRLALFDSATTSSLSKSADPFVRLALALRPLEKEMEERGERHAGALALLKPRYIAALREFARGALAPDANGTLRVTYGTVRGYRPAPDADVYEPFTVLPGVIAKDRNEEPFDVPDRLVAAYQRGGFGRYVDDDLGQVPVNFLSDLDTTGGNSGSATLNGKGELVGLLFDGNYESMASDWLFIPSTTRSIHVDIRYVLWLMDAVDHAEHLIREMGVEPSVD